MPRINEKITDALSEATWALAEITRAVSTKTNGGKTIDEHQVTARAVAYANTCIAACKALLESEVSSSGQGLVRGAAIVDLVKTAALELEDASTDITTFTSVARDMNTLVQEDALREIGRLAAEKQLSWGLDETHEQVRSSVKQFAIKEVEPKAEHIHRTDALVPDKLINAMAELGFFGLSIPESYDGFDMGNLAMILTTEELSRASLAAAGSLITRPEILAKALVAGGTDAQKKKWLPLLASGEIMAAISVTEPNVGSDVASLSCRASRATDGRDGWTITGAKAWCTFAGRADVIAVLCRTEEDVSLGAKGLSLFIVEKDVFDGHEFEMTQESGGKLMGKADATPGYRGMHSFTLSFENYFVPAENLVGESAGQGRGFYLQMAGFAAGRLQTGGRACGLAQAAIDKTCTYVTDRSQFGKPLIEYQLTQYELGRMAAKLEGARAITYAAALAMDEDPRAGSLIAAQAKLLACDVAVWITQKGQLLHGGWGYAEEYPISRYAIDALVLPIFEGVKPVLELKVIARQLLKEAQS